MAKIPYLLNKQHFPGLKRLSKDFLLASVFVKVLYILPIVIFISGLFAFRYMYQNNFVRESISEVITESDIPWQRVLGEQKIDPGAGVLPPESRSLYYEADITFEGYLRDREGNKITLLKQDFEPITLYLSSEESLIVTCVDAGKCICDNCGIDDIETGQRFVVMNTYSSIANKDVISEIPVKSTVLIK